MKLLVILATMMVSFGAFANEPTHGVWTATNDKCTVTFRVKLTEEFLSISQRTYVCDDTDFTLEERVFAVKDGSVMHEGKGIGIANRDIIKFGSGTFSMTLYPREKSFMDGPVSFRGRILAHHY